MLGAITEIEPHYRKSSQQQLLLETLLVRFALLDRTVEIEDLLRGLGEGGSGRTNAASTERRSAEPPKPSARRTEPARVSAPLADAPAPPAKAAGRRSLDLNALCEQWGDVVSGVRSAGRPMLVSALEHALPVAVTGQGTIAVQLDQPNDIFERAIETGAADILTAVSSLFDGAVKLVVRRAEVPAAANADAPRRLTEEEMRRERAQLLRKKDPTLDAAIQELDLELLD
jgi:DNA polymerase-3 subunit gamma/tau